MSHIIKIRKYVCTVHSDRLICQNLNVTKDERIIEYTNIEAISLQMPHVGITHRHDSSSTDMTHHRTENYRLNIVLAQDELVFNLKARPTFIDEIIPQLSWRQFECPNTEFCSTAIITLNGKTQNNKIVKFEEEISLILIRDRFIELYPLQDAEFFIEINIR